MSTSWSLHNPLGFVNKFPQQIPPTRWGNSIVGAMIAGVAISSPPYPKQMEQWPVDLDYVCTYLGWNSTQLYRDEPTSSSWNAFRRFFVAVAQIKRWISKHIPIHWIFKPPTPFFVGRSCNFTCWTAGLVKLFLGGWNPEAEKLTLPKTKIAPEIQWLEDEVPFGNGLYSEAMLVSGRVSVFSKIFSQVGNQHHSPLHAEVHHRGEKGPPGMIIPYMMVNLRGKIFPQNFLQPFKF